MKYMYHCMLTQVACKILATFQASSMYTHTHTHTHTFHFLCCDTFQNVCSLSPYTVWSWDDSEARRRAVGREDSGRPWCTQTQGGPHSHSVPLCKTHAAYACMHVTTHRERGDKMKSTVWIYFIYSHATAHEYTYMYMYIVYSTWNKEHAGTMKLSLHRGVLYSVVKLYTKVLVSDRNKCPL